MHPRYWTRQDNVYVFPYNFFPLVSEDPFDLIICMNYAPYVLRGGRDHDYGRVCVLSEQCLLIHHCGSVLLLLHLVRDHVESFLKVDNGVILIIDDVH